MRSSQLLNMDTFVQLPFSLTAFGGASCKKDVKQILHVGQWVCIVPSVGACQRCNRCKGMQVVREAAIEIVDEPSLEADD